MTTKYDCVYFWVGGRSVGEWRKATLAPADYGGAESLSVLRDECERGGRPAVLGYSPMGSPEGAPNEAAFKRCGV